MTTGLAIQFELGRRYSRKEIGEMLKCDDSGGGGLENYLPFSRHKVICGCFKLSVDPDAPNVVLVGSSPRVRGPGIQFAAQKGIYVPVFIMRHSAAWEYVGDYTVRSWSEKPEDLRATDRGDVTRILYLERKPEPPPTASE